MQEFWARGKLVTVVGKGNILKKGQALSNGRETPRIRKNSKDSKR